MFVRNGISFVQIVLYAHVTTLTLIRLVHCQTSNKKSIGCIDNQRRCYVVYSWPDKDYQSASETCSSQYNGNLVTIYNNSTQERLLRRLTNSAGVHLTADYWIGAQLELLDNWTWLDGTTYSALDSISGYPDPHIYGYASIRMNGWPPSWHLTTVTLNEAASSLKPQHALCECKIDGCMRDNKHPNRYFSVTASRWFDGRNACLREGADLAVLTSCDQLNGIVQENVDYFLGLTNVRLVWVQSTGTGNDAIANYTNFNDRSPNSEYELCVILYPEDGKWNVVNCNLSIPFICEYEGVTHAAATPRTISRTSSVISSSKTNPPTVSSTTTTTTTTSTTTTTTTTSLPTTRSTTRNNSVNRTSTALVVADNRAPSHEQTTDSNNPVSGNQSGQSAVTVAVIALSLILFLLIAVGFVTLCCLRRKKTKRRSEEIGQSHSANHYQRQQQQMTSVGQSSTTAPIAADEVQYATIVHAGDSLQPISSNRKNGERGGKPVKEEPQYSEVVTQRRGPPIKSKPRIGSYNRTSSSSTSASKTASQSQVQPNVNNKETATDSNTVYACIVTTSCPVDTSTNNDQSVIYAGLM